MKKQDRLYELFDKARSENPVMDLKQIEHHLRSGKKVSVAKSKLGKPGRGLFNPLNLIVMFSSIIIFVSAILFIPGSSSSHVNSEPDQETTVMSHQQQAASGKRQAASGKRQAANGERQAASDKLEAASDEYQVTREEESDKGSVLSVRHGEGNPTRRSPLESRHSKRNDASFTLSGIPSDTLFIGEVLYLTQEELTRLGFLFNENGFFYCNQDERGYMNFYSDQFPDDTIPGNSSAIGFTEQPRNLRKEITHFPFHVGSQTGLAGERLKEYRIKVNSVNIHTGKYWDDEAVPVYFPGRWYAEEGVSDRIIWFSVTDEFFDLLPPEKVAETQKRVNLVKQMRSIPGNETRNLVDYNLPGINSKRVNPIELDIETMLKLGIRVVKNQGLNYRYHSEQGFLELTLAANASSFRNQKVADPDEVMPEGEFNAPMLGVTQLNGEFAVAISTEFYPLISDTISFFSNMYDVAIPVIFNDTNLPLIAHESIFWFHPNDAFFDHLPDSIGAPMRNEYNVNVAPKLRVSNRYDRAITIVGVRHRDDSLKTKASESIPCQYFSSFCESLPGLDHFNFYPNPTAGELNIELTLGMGKVIDYRVFDLSGRLVIDEIERKTYDSAGLYRERIDLGHLEKGFYLLVLTDGEGARMTKRIVKN